MLEYSPGHWHELHFCLGHRGLQKWALNQDNSQKDRVKVDFDIAVIILDTFTVG